MGGSDDDANASLQDGSSCIARECGREKNVETNTVSKKTTAKVSTSNRITSVSNAILGVRPVWMRNTMVHCY